MGEALGTGRLGPIGKPVGSGLSLGVDPERIPMRWRWRGASRAVDPSCVARDRNFLEGLFGLYQTEV